MACFCVKIDRGFLLCCMIIKFQATVFMPCSNLLFDLLHGLLLFVIWLSYARLLFSGAAQ